VLVVGANGAGKTNLLEAVHVGSQGFSPRTRSDAEIVRFGAHAGRIVLRAAVGSRTVGLDVCLDRNEGKRARVNGAVLRAFDQLRAELAVLVFTPDRLVVVKGGPAVRRAYFDRALARVRPGRSTLAADYSAALAQRNIALRRVAAGHSSHLALAPWTERVVELGAQLVSAREELIRELEPFFRAIAAELGIARAELRYEAVLPTPEVLAARLDRDLERGTTGAGPHLDDVGIISDGRELRAFGSQGEQRLAVLALLLAEAELLSQRRAAPPLLLLDDVLSELDERRRHVLTETICDHGQALVTATTARALPREPAELVEVTPGFARRR
jgi:DNA replication and repair protein RecF